MQLYCNKKFFGTIEQYFYETPWATGRLVAQDKGQHDLHMRVCDFLDWVLFEGESDLTKEEEDKQYFDEMSKRGLTEKDIERYKGTEWVIVTGNGEEHRAYSFSFLDDGFVQWRW